MVFPFGFGVSPARDLTIKLKEPVPMRVITMRGQTLKGGRPGSGLGPVP